MKNEKVIVATRESRDISRVSAQYKQNPSQRILMIAENRYFPQMDVNR